MPAQIVELDEVPRREDGSVDRTSLRDPLAPQDTHVAPRTPTEKAVARVWQDVLGVDRVGLTDNFFDLGGHSLLSTRVIVQLYKKLQVRLDQPTMVLHTLEQIAREIDGRRVPAPLETAAEASVPSPVDTNRSRGLFRSLLSRS
jgi:acyl carrier protein